MIVIGGAGWCGLNLAQGLDQECLILEKSRGVGGRLATRRVEDFSCDHGAQVFGDQKEGFLQVEIKKEFPFKFKDNFWAQKAGVNQVAKNTAKGLEIHRKILIEKVERKKSSFNLLCSEGKSYQADKVILTFPIPQVIKVLQYSNISYPEKLKDITYTPFLVLMGGSVDKNSLPEGFHFLDQGNYFSKRVEKEVNLYSFYFPLNNHEFDKVDQEKEKFLSIASSAVGNFSFCDWQKWRYAGLKNTLTGGFLELEENFFIAGEAFSQGNLKGAEDSALALAQEINRRESHA